MNKERVVLEKSTNTHFTDSKVEVKKELENMTTMIMKVEKGGMIVEHGHHNTVATEETTTDVVKITQQEYNPLLQAFQNAFD